MTHRFHWLACSLAAITLALGAAADAAAQAAPATPAAAAPTAAPSGPAPRTASGKPDLSGVWTVPYVPDMTRSRPNQKGMAELPFTPEGEANFKAYDPANGDYTGVCMPFGLVRSMNAPYPLQIMQNDKYVAILWEQSTWFHVIPVDRPVKVTAASENPQWFGHSVGRWEGDTLVVETSGFNGYTRLDTIGHPHSDQLRVRQTFQRTDADHIAYTITIDDPKMYTKPWSNERVFTASTGELIEVLVRGEQQEPVGRAHQDMDAALGDARRAGYPRSPRPTCPAITEAGAPGMRRARAGRAGDAHHPEDRQPSLSGRACADRGGTPPPWRAGLNRETSYRHG